MIRKLLIANRGEIACRVIKTAREMGVKTVAVYSDVDATARHVTLADEAYPLGGAAPAESYLVVDKLLAAIRETGADAVHPGYGFLSENSGFARAVAEAGAVFVGPPATAIDAMGSKSEAKRIMGDAGVPLVPGYHGDDQDPDFLKTQADEIGYPVLIKASAGGGGKGMRAVERAEEFADALVSCKREALASFSDEKVLIEKLIVKPRHVEIQVFADSHGEAVYLFERDCSVQRRHQKVIEEAPAPGMTEELREKMGGAAVAAAKAIGYQGAGTVEFLLDASGAFYFMEMNTRLQVEHPVTEMITGQDLVAWQLKVASGQKLPLAQDALTLSGHSVEVRLYAEDPAKDFLPQTGPLAHLRLPDGPNVRVDTGVVEGDTVSIHYDPMIAKIITWGADRDAALRTMAAALDDTEVVPLATNVRFLKNLATHPAFLAADVDTGFIGRFDRDLIPAEGAVADTDIALASLHVLLDWEAAASARAAASDDPYSPWHLTTGWRMNDGSHDDLLFRLGEEEISVMAYHREDGFTLTLPGDRMTASAVRLADGKLRANLGGRKLTATVVRHEDELFVLRDGAEQRLTLIDPLTSGGEDDAAAGGLTAPMPGKIIAVNVATGDTVAAGDALVVMEAMKMEHTITAPKAGTVTDVFYAVGDQVEDGAALLGLEEA